jgi:hypothetical protein
MCGTMNSCKLIQEFPNEVFMSSSSRFEKLNLFKVSATDFVVEKRVEIPRDRIK